MPPMTEASEAIFQDQVIRLAKMQGWLIFHASPKMVRPGVWRSDGRGFPDLVLVHKGGRGIIYAELKTDLGRLSEHQLDWGEAILTAGGEYHVWRPQHLQAIAKRLGPQ
jgi:hypothetical protein